MATNLDPIDHEDEEGVDEVEDYDKPGNYEGMEIWEAYEIETEKIKNRFLLEFDKLIYRGEIRSARHYAEIIKSQNSIIASIKRGQHKVNIRTLWITKKNFPKFDVDYILWGVRSELRPKP